MSGRIDHLLMMPKKLEKSSNLGADSSTSNTATSGSGTSAAAPNAIPPPQFDRQLVTKKSAGNRPQLLYARPEMDDADNDVDDTENNVRPLKKGDKKSQNDENGGAGGGHRSSLRVPGTEGGSNGGMGSMVATIRPGRSVTFSTTSSVEIDELTSMYPNSDGECSSDIVLEKPREGWDNKFQFLMGVISYAVGLGNVWRFPYLCQQNGGGAFLIPYCVMMLLEGMPLFLIEMGIGQRLRVGPIGVWNAIHPYMGGVGVASAVVSFLVALYYNVIITWCLFYFGYSFQATLPWKDCPMVNNTKEPECEQSSETAYFWYRQAVDTTESIEDIGGINLKMLLCLMASWLIVWICVMKGIKTSGKVMYVTATFPYIVTTIFLVRSVMLKGAAQGVEYMFTPNMTALADPRVWLDAATQVFYSMGLAFGGLIAFASYNPIKNNVKRDVIVLSVANIVTSLYTAICIFCILGYKGMINFEKCLSLNIDSLKTHFPHVNFSANPVSIEQYRDYRRYDFTNTIFAGFNEPVDCQLNKTIKEAAEGTGLAFIAFTQAMVEFPWAPFWAVMFFLMLLMLGLGSMFGTLEGVITSIYDLHLFTWLKKPVLTAIICGISFVIGLVFVTNAGEYWVKLFDSYAGSYGLMGVAFFEVIGVIYVYGWRRFCRDIEFMTGEYPSLYWQLTWRFISPMIMFFLFFASMIMSFLKTPEYDAYNRTTAKTHKEPYPVWAMFIAGFLVVSTMVPVPFVWFVRKFKIMRFEPDPSQQASKRRLQSCSSTSEMLRGSNSFHQLTNAASTISEMKPIGSADSSEGLTGSGPATIQLGGGGDSSPTEADIVVSQTKATRRNSGGARSSATAGKGGNHPPRSASES